jgi:glycosyltransferase involved in cell wall biosynthesis
MEFPEITVLMPVYNAERYLNEAIDSILQQTFKNFEFLIIDDGSTDSTVEIVKSYNDPRIHFIRNHQNLGIAATLNKGIEMSSANLVARMDADDISYRNRLQKQFDFFQANPECSILATWAREVTMDKRHLIIESFNEEYYYYMLNFECWIYHPTVMYKRSSVMDSGMYSIPYCEDYDLWWKMTRKYKLGVIEEVLLDYRSTEDSLSRVNRKKEYEEFHHKLVFRNLNYYTLGSVCLSDNEVEFLRCNCDLFLLEKNNNVQEILKLFKKIDKTKDYILSKPNVNLNRSSTNKAALYQKRRFINMLRIKLSHRKIILLLIGLNEIKLLIRILAGKMKRYINSQLF